MGLGIYIEFKNETEKAVEFYSKVFNVKCEEMTKYGTIGGHPKSAEFNDLVINAKLDIHGVTVMFSDTEGVNDDMIVGTNITVVITTDNEELLTNEFNALAEEGHVVMPLGKTFWSEKYGLVIDKFGIGWQYSLT